MAMAQADTGEMFGCGPIEDRYKRIDERPVHRYEHEQWFETDSAQSAVQAHEYLYGKSSKLGT